jgi:hypothetical protein
MVRVGVVAMAAAITIVIAGSWLHATASSSRPVVHPRIDVLSLMLLAQKRMPVQAFDAI